MRAEAGRDRSRTTRAMGTVAVRDVEPFNRFI
jgi:hypothetical protein